MEEEGLAIKVILDGWWGFRGTKKYNVLIMLLLSGHWREFDGDNVGGEIGYSE